MTALSVLDVPVSVLPPTANQLLLEHSAGATPMLLTPALLRQLVLRKGLADVTGSGLGGAAAAVVLHYCMEDVIDSDPESVMQVRLGRRGRVWACSTGATGWVMGASWKPHMLLNA